MARRRYVIDAVDSPLSWEDLRSREHLKTLQPLIDYLSRDCHHTAVVAALVALKGHFKAIESDDNCEINEARGFACELVAWQFVLTLSDQEALEYLLFELREDDDGGDGEDADEETGLLAGLRNGLTGSDSSETNGHQNGNGRNARRNTFKPSNGEGFAEPFMNLVSSWNDLYPPHHLFSSRQGCHAALRSWEVSCGDSYFPYPRQVLT